MRRFVHLYRAAALLPLSLCLLCVVPARWLVADDNARPSAIDFNSQIRPLLSDKCFACHGPDAAHRQAGLRLDDEAAAKEFAIAAGDALASPLVERVLSTDPASVMPPPELDKALTAEEIELLRRWIDAGANYAKHWAYVDPVLLPTPQIADDGWSKNWIDAFVLAGLRKRGMQPAEDADPVDLIRRLSFDLTGLPPEPDQIRALADSPSDAAYEQLVDKLLGSTAFGERFAVMWLDLVRYADTVGYHGDQDHAIAPYRDWVINALNANMPFDQFTREQLAGDLLPNATLDQRVATGYNRMLQTSHEGGVQPAEYLAIYQADRVRNLSAVWMGATIGCAQCHDHKYDPYTARDFYALAAFFADIDEAQHFKVGDNALPTRRPPEIDVLPEPLRWERARLQASLDQQREKGVETAALEQQIAELDRRKQRTMVSVSIEPREVRVLPRGNWLDNTGEVVQPAVPEMFARPLGSDGRASRLDLANWLVDVEAGVGGLTARVMVNRLWYTLFGNGLSPSLDDFGGQGIPPLHPELLDQLAIRFYQNGWDIKQLLREMVLSRTYRVSSVPSSDRNDAATARKWFALQSRYRLPAEMVRDTALSLGDLLVRDASGETSRPYQPAGYYRHLNFPERKYQADDDSKQFRRGVYVHWQRQFLHPMLRAFDAPNREECTAQRPRSNTPLAALVLLNDPTFIEAARGLAARTLDNARDEGGTRAVPLDDRDRIQFMFELAVGRHPDSTEQQVLVELLNASRENFRKHPDSAQPLLDIGLWPADRRLGKNLDKIELAAWCEVARTILNLNETMLRP